MTSRAEWAAAIVAVDPGAVGGVCLRGPPSPLRDQWLELLRGLLPDDAPVRRIPFNIADTRLIGGLDLAATLRSGTAVAERGALANTDGGVLVVSMAERLSVHTAKTMADALDWGEVRVLREGISATEPARVAIVALDEGLSDDECIPACLLDRLALLLDFSEADSRSMLLPAHERDDIAAARARVAHVDITPELREALCATAMSLDVLSLRISQLALRVARIISALNCRSQVELADLKLAAELVLAPRANVAPPEAKAPEQTPPDTTPPDTTPPETTPPQAKSPDNALPNQTPPGGASPGDGGTPEPTEPPAELDARVDPAAGEQGPQSPSESSAGSPQVQELLLAAAQAAIPRGLLERLRVQANVGRSPPSRGAGRVGNLRAGGRRGRPSGICKGLARNARLNVIATLRAAAPWQRLRSAAARQDANSRGPFSSVGCRYEIDPASPMTYAQSAKRVIILAEDLRATRYKQRAQSLTIFVVDASGSAALNRLAEAKGAVELLLADCYIRRDQVAVITFRGRAAGMLLPPTRSLVRAKRGLAALPGGGGTPLAAAIDAAALLGAQALRRGESPTVVLLTDGRGNVARDGSVGRPAGHADAMKAAGKFRAARVSALLVDTSPRPNALAQELAVRMNATYVPLPFANASSLSKLVAGAARARS